MRRAVGGGGDAIPRFIRRDATRFQTLAFLILGRGAVAEYHSKMNRKGHHYDGESSRDEKALATSPTVTA